jgi:hypothetical protein
LMAVGGGVAVLLRCWHWVRKCRSCRYSCSQAMMSWARPKNF